MFLRIYHISTPSADYLYSLSFVSLPAWYHAAMRSTIAIHTLTLTIAIVAVVFAVWPVVTDAPWENDAVDRTAEIRCDGALSFRETIIEAGPFSQGSFTERFSTGPGNPGGVENYDAQLAKAEREISRYC